MFTFENMDDIRDDYVLATVNSPRKVFALTKSKSSAPKSFRRMPSLDGQVSSVDIEDEEERQCKDFVLCSARVLYRIIFNEVVYSLTCNFLIKPSTLFNSG